MLTDRGMSTQFSRDALVLVDKYATNISCV